MSQPFIQILYEQYRTEYYGPWHTRECYPWEYDTKAQECLERGAKSSYFVTDDDCKWFLQQAKILRDRAGYIRQQWATQLATQQATPPTPEQQVFQPPKQEQEQEQDQCNAENNAEKIAENIAENTAESTAKNGSSKPDIKSTLSTIPRQGTMPIFRDPTACPSDALLFACQHTTFLALTWQPPYIEYAEEMKATGQG